MNRGGSVLLNNQSVRSSFYLKNNTSIPPNESLKKYMVDPHLDLYGFEDDENTLN